MQRNKLMLFFFIFIHIILKIPIVIAIKKMILFLTRFLTDLIMRLRMSAVNEEENPIKPLALKWDRFWGKSKCLLRSVIVFIINIISRKAHTKKWTRTLSLCLAHQFLHQNPDLCFLCFSSLASNLSFSTEWTSIQIKRILDRYQVDKSRNYLDLLC